MRKILFCFGTRPEAIKLAPVIAEAKKEQYEVYICLTGQHKEMILPFLEFFELKPDFNLNIMRPNQSLIEMTSNILLGMKDVLDSLRPEMIFVQGDTTTTFACGLAAFYYKIPVAHIEAGLRTGDKYSPFPEEINRKMVTSFSELHFPPTEATNQNLIREGISENVFVTGNTSIDALRLTSKIITDKSLHEIYEQQFSFIDFNRKILLVTAHRRENQGQALENICEALIEIINANSDVEIVIPVHLNPQVKKVIEHKLKKIKRVHLLGPLEYPVFVWFMQKSFLIITDSGGIQEEGPYFSKPILVIRDNTERPEGVEAGTTKLIGTKKSDIFEQANLLINNLSAYEKFTKAQNPYGDGQASAKIMKAVREYFLQI